MSEKFEVFYDENKTFTLRPLANVSTIGAGEVLVAPKYIGICGSDRYLICSNLSSLRLGHEWVGVVLETGSGVTKFAKGDVVTGTGHFACGSCAPCLSGKSNLCKNAVHFSSDKIGALRSEFSAPESQIFKVSSTLSPALALLEVFGVGEQAHYLLAEEGLKPEGTHLAVFGAGAIGLATALVMQSYGFNPVIFDVDNSRIERAAALGFQTALTGVALVSRQFDHAFNVIIDCTNDYDGQPGAFKFLPHFAQKEFTALVVGKYLQPQTISTGYNSLAARLIWMRGVSNTNMAMAVTRWQTKLQDLQSVFVTKIYDWKDCAGAFAAAADKKTSLKILIEISPF